MSIHRLFAVLVALAVLFAPGAATASMAAPSAHQMQMMDDGHCEAPPSGMDHHDRMDGKTCCISMLMGVAVLPAAAVIEPQVRLSRPVFAIPSLHRSYLGEIATPPPRTA